MKELTSFTLLVTQKLEEEGRFGTAHVYRSMLHAFQTYWNNKHPEGAIPMKKVFTPATLQGFEKHLQERMLKMNTLSTYLRMLRAVYNRALAAGLVSYVPGLFARVYTGTRSDVKRALSPQDVGRLLIAPAPQSSGLAQAQIWFSLLFLLRGMPFADLAHLRKCDLQGGVITYRRQKTGRMLAVRLTSEAAALIKRCADQHPGSPYLLDILWNGQENAVGMGSFEEYKRYREVLRSFNLRLKRLARLLGISSNLSSYAARHSWATIAFHRKCNVGVISNALGHSSVKVTETYLKPFDNEVLDKANSTIIAYVKRSIL